MPTEGQQVGPYELVRKLGQGAFGEVWLARHRHLGVERAVKIPTDPACVRQLRLEGVLQSDLDHPNIVRTFDLDPDHDPPYFVMEYVEGESLRERLRREGRLAPDEAVRILCHVLGALVAAHDAGVLHRDLKPENILLRADGTVKLSDFGLGKVQAEVTRSLLVSGSMMSASGRSVSGTYAYMSPEQQAGEDPTPGDDLYALGVVACELLAGERPAPGIPLEELLKEAGVDPAFCPLIQKALTRPKRRYSSAAGMLEAFEVGAKPQPALAPLPGAPAQPRPAPTPPPLPKPRVQLYPGWPFNPAEAKRRQKETAALGVPVEKHVDLGDGVKLTLVLIPAGEFDMGSPEGEEGRYSCERLHRVRITKPFYIGKHPVTQAQWQTVTAENPSKFRGAANPLARVWDAVTGKKHPEDSESLGRPVEAVSWEDCERFTEELNYHLGGGRFALPTEAQWEYACRAGSDMRFWFGHSTSNLGKYAWCNGNSGAETHPVGQKRPNAWGLHDVHGNVWEWCADWYANYPTPDAEDPRGPSYGKRRVLRGGSCGAEPEALRSASRRYGEPTLSLGTIGVRVACALQE